MAETTKPKRTAAHTPSGLTAILKLANGDESARDLVVEAERHVWDVWHEIEKEQSRNTPTVKSRPKVPTIISKFDNSCRHCGGAIHAGMDYVSRDAELGKWIHTDCWESRNGSD